MAGFVPLTAQGNQNLYNQAQNNAALISALRNRGRFATGSNPLASWTPGAQVTQLPQQQPALNMSNFTDMMNRYNYGNALQSYQNSPQGMQNQWLATVSRNPQQYQTPNFDQWMANGRQFGPQTFSGVFGPFGRGYGGDGGG